MHVIATRQNTLLLLRATDTIGSHPAIIMNIEENIEVRLLTTEKVLFRNMVNIPIAEIKIIFTTHEANGLLIQLPTEGRNNPEGVSISSGLPNKIAENENTIATTSITTAK